MNNDDSCIFCQILARAAPGSFVYRDEHCAAFMDIEPMTPGHVLVVPLAHAAGLGDLTAAAAARLMHCAHGLAAAARRGAVDCEGVNLFLADGAVAGQEVFHVHLHVIPRLPGDGFGLKWDPGRRVRPREQLDEAARRIRQELAPRE